MKTRSTLICCLLLLAFSANAALVNRQEASDVAATFLKQPFVKEVAVPFEHLYVFNGDHCFVIVPDDDVLAPIIGYSHDGCFEVESMNDNLKGWLMQIDENIQACKDAGKQATDKVRGQWGLVRKGHGLPVVNRSIIEPLVKTRWAQGDPYNGSCPGGSVTGCAATAMAQVMKYWEFPNHGIGSHSYVHPDYGTLSVDFSTATYDWDHMPLKPFLTTINDVERQALSTLMYHCGVSIDMNYSPDESAGDMTKMVSSMPEYFGYAPTIEWRYQSTYSEEAWKSLLKAELNALRPMCYASALPHDGRSRAAFHAFVCDGYDEFDYFHFNWGWGGSGDGYYAVNSMVPVGETNYNYVVKGISPIFTVAAPNDLTADMVHGQVQLSWTQPQGTVSCNVYRDDELIAIGVTTNSYCDSTMSFGTHSYYLKAIDGNGNRSWKSTCVEVFYEFVAPNPTALSASVSGEYLTLHWDMPSPMNDTLAYGTGQCVGSYGYSPTYPNPTFWGQRYPAEMLKPFAGYYIKGVSLYVTVLGPYTLNICRGNDRGVTEVMAQQSFEIDDYGWVDMLLDTPYPLDFTQDVWTVMNTPGGMYWVSAACEYDGPGLEDAAFYSTEMTDFFYLHGLGHSWMMKTMIEDGLTYRVTRNDVLLATGWHGHDFVDRDLSEGDWTYKVWSSYQGVECDEPVSYSISLARVDAVASDIVAGTIQGTGPYEVGTMAAVSAQPNEGYAFAAWLENGVEVSTDNPYSFCVEDSRYLVAQFKGTGVDEDNMKVKIAPNPVMDELYVESAALIRRIEITTVNGMMVENKKVDNYSVICHLGDCAEGVYFLRLFTDEGVITKKIVVSE